MLKEKECKTDVVIRLHMDIAGFLERFFPDIAPQVLNATEVCSIMIKNKWTDSAHLVKLMRLAILLEPELLRTFSFRRQTTFIRSFFVGGQLVVLLQWSNPSGFFLFSFSVLASIKKALQGHMHKCIAHCKLTAPAFITRLAASERSTYFLQPNPANMAHNFYGLKFIGQIRAWNLHV